MNELEELLRTCAGSVLDDPALPEGGQDRINGFVASTLSIAADYVAAPEGTYTTAELARRYRQQREALLGYVAEQRNAKRAETDPCERGTVGCSVMHKGEEPCATW